METNYDERDWHWRGDIKHVSHNEWTWNNSDGRSWHWTGTIKHMQEDEEEHYYTYKKQKQKLLLYLLKGRKYWKGFILISAQNDCKGNGIQQTTDGTLYRNLQQMDSEK